MTTLELNSGVADAKHSVLDQIEQPEMRQMVCAELPPKTYPPSARRWVQPNGTRVADQDVPLPACALEELLGGIARGSERVLVHFELLDATWCQDRGQSVRSFGQVPGGEEVAGAGESHGLRRRDADA
jgi:hypothetical protein